MSTGPFNTEDAFVSGEDGWIVLPGGAGKVSPAGIVYDENGEEMYSIYEDSEPSRIEVIYANEDYEWI